MEQKKRQRLSILDVKKFVLERRGNVLSNLTLRSMGRAKDIDRQAQSNERILQKAIMFEKHGKVCLEKKTVPVAQMQKRKF